MSKAIGARCRKFPARIPKQELMERASEVLREKGAEHESQAKMMSYLCREIRATRNPSLSSLAAAPKRRAGKTWAIAQALVTAYLNSMKMELTQSTIEMESNGKKMETDFSSFDAKSYGAFMATLIESSKKSQDFSTRVQESGLKGQAPAKKQQKIAPEPQKIKMEEKTQRRSNETPHIPEKSQISEKKRALIEAHDIEEKPSAKAFTKPTIKDMASSNVNLNLSIETPKKAQLKEVKQSPPKGAKQPQQKEVKQSPVDSEISMDFVADVDEEEKSKHSPRRADGPNQSSEAIDVEFVQSSGKEEQSISFDDSEIIEIDSK